MKIIVLIGPPGSGKGTQAKKLTEQNTKFRHISTGDLLRKAVAGGSETGKVIKGYINEGKLVPDEVVIELIEKELKSGREDTIYVFDGFPRNLSQARQLEEILSKNKIELKEVINIQLELEEVVKRLSGRMVCPKCGRVYHKVFNKPEQDNVCDVDRTKLMTREDDKEEVVRDRYNLYKKTTEPVLNYYKEKNKLVIIDGKQHKDKVFDEISGKLK